MPIPINPAELTAANVQVIYKNVPFYLTPVFAITVILFIACIIIILYAWFRISLRNRMNVIIHMPDKTRQVYTYKKFNGNKFEIEGNETDKDGARIKNFYNFRSEAVETGYFGRYIEFDYGNAEPRKYNSSPHFLDYTFISSLLNTQLAVDLLLSSKFKEFVKLMLVVIVILLGINLILGGYIAYSIYSTQPQTAASCSLELTNRTIETWRILQTIR